MTAENRLRLKYILADFVTTNLALLLFNVYRYYEMSLATTGFISLSMYLSFPTLLAGQILFPIAMIGVYYISGYYNMVYVKSRAEEFLTSLTTAFIGTLLLFFVVLINDLTHERTHDYSLFFMLFALMFFVVYIPRLIITWRTSNRLWRGQIQFPTVVVGYSSHPKLFAEQMRGVARESGMRVVAFVDADDASAEGAMVDGMPVWNITEMAPHLDEKGVDRIIVTPHPQGWEHSLGVVNKLFQFDRPIYMSADRLPTFMFNTQMLSLSSEPFIDVSRSRLSPSTLNIKRVFDVVVSSLAIAVTAIPIGLMAIAVKIDSAGPAFYRQERVGLHRRRFNIIKLRTMRTDAESAGPELTSQHDARVTRLGHFLRKYRLDELPQFFNVLMGQMSIVGPRPERAHFIAQIMEREPSYTLLHRLRPGITSLGMVKYGYASNVDEMVERLRYDLLYLENISLATDIKIILHTIHTVVTGKGL